MNFLQIINCSFYIVHIWGWDLGCHLWVKVWSYVSPLLIYTGCNVMLCKTVSYPECIIAVWHKLSIYIDLCIMAAMSSHIWSPFNMWLLLQLCLWGYAFKLVCLVTMCTLYHQYVNRIYHLKKICICISRFWRELFWSQGKFSHMQNATMISLIVKKIWIIKIESEFEIKVSSVGWMAGLWKIITLILPEIFRSG